MKRINNHKYEVLAVIPARGGSKGIPRKNVRLLNGKPLISYTIENAINATSINRVIVSTDDPEIKTISKVFGAEVIDRPIELSGDNASSESAVIQVLSYLDQKENYKPDLVVFLQCTSPLTLPEDIDGTVFSLHDENADTALTVTDFHYFLWEKDEAGAGKGINHNKEVRILRQNRKNQFIETGAVYVMRTSLFNKKQHRFFGKTALYVMPEERCLEIDEPVDFKIAEVLMQSYHRGKMINRLPEKISAIVLDFDGVFTDNKVIVMEDGREAVVCNRSDGMGISMIKALNIHVTILSSEINPVVKARCDKLGINCIHGLTDKLQVLRKWLEENTIDPENVIYLGNDLNDLSCMKAVGCAVAVNDAYPEIHAAAKISLNSKGGEGAVRELADLIREKQNSTNSQ